MRKGSKKNDYSKQKIKTITENPPKAGFSFRAMPYERINLIPIYIALGVGALLVVLALWKKVLTRPACATAFVVLLLASLFTSYVGLVVFSLSFSLSAIVSLVKREKRKEREEGIYPHVGARGVVQVLSNAMPALIYGAVYFATGIPAFMVASAVTVVAGVADSFASDLGIISDGKVVSILTFKEVPRGMSGGVSLFGTLSAFLSSLIVALALFGVGNGGVKGLWVTALSAFLGTVIDSILGASVQRAYKCEECGSLTERKEHCGSPTVLVKGCAMIDNNLVNALSLVIAGAIAIGLYMA